MTGAEHDAKAQPPRPLSRQSGFWRRLSEDGRLHKTDVLRIREDLHRLEELTQKMNAGGACCEDVAGEIKRVREVVMKDYATQALVIQTLIEILLDKGVMTEDEFEDKMDAIDARDGKRDGMLSPRPEIGGAQPNEEPTP